MSILAFLSRLRGLGMLAVFAFTPASPASVTWSSSDAPTQAGQADALLQVGNARLQHDSLHADGAAKQPSCSDGALMFDQATVMSSNLGGFGGPPAPGDEGALRYGNIMQLPDGSAADLVVTALGGYESLLPSENGIYGHTGAINLKCGPEAVLKFRFVRHGDNATASTVSPAPFYFSVLNIGRLYKNDGIMELVVNNISHFELSSKTAIIATELGASSSVRFAPSDMASPPDLGLDVPDAMDMAASEAARSMTVVFPEGTNEFTMSVRVSVGSCSSKTLQFAGPSALVCNCPWMSHSGVDDLMECEDGSFCINFVEGWECCRHRDGRKKCPANYPEMCGTPACGGDFCCAVAGKCGAMGVRTCPSSVRRLPPEEPPSSSNATTGSAASNSSATTENATTTVSISNATSGSAANSSNVTDESTTPVASGSNATIGSAASNSSATTENATTTVSIINATSGSAANSSNVTDESTIPVASGSNATSESTTPVATSSDAATESTSSDAAAESTTPVASSSNAATEGTTTAITTTPSSITTIGGSAVPAAGNTSTTAAACPWDSPSPMENHFSCADGVICDGTLDGWDCCKRRGGRVRCPKNFPFMCNTKHCDGDWCCTPDTCALLGGPRVCMDCQESTCPCNAYVQSADCPEDRCIWQSNACADLGPEVPALAQATEEPAATAAAAPTAATVASTSTQTTIEPATAAEAAVEAAAAAPTSVQTTIEPATTAEAAVEPATNTTATPTAAAVAATSAQTTMKPATTAKATVEPATTATAAPTTAGEAPTSAQTTTEPATTAEATPTAAAAAPTEPATTAEATATAATVAPTPAQASVEPAAPATAAPRVAAVAPTPAFAECQFGSAKATLNPWPPIKDMSSLLGHGIESALADAWRSCTTQVTSIAMENVTYIHGKHRSHMVVIGGCLPQDPSAYGKIQTLDTASLLSTCRSPMVDAIGKIATVSSLDLVFMEVCSADKVCRQVDQSKGGSAALVADLQTGHRPAKKVWHKVTLM